MEPNLVVDGVDLADLTAVTAALGDRLGRFANQEDYAAVLAPEALYLGCAVLTAASTPGVAATDAAELLRLAAWLRWFRYDALTNGPEPDKQQADTEHESALVLFTVLYWTRSELVPPSQQKVVTALAQAGVSKTSADQDVAVADALLGLARVAGDQGGVARSAELYSRALQSGTALTDRPRVLIHLSLALLARSEFSQDSGDLTRTIAAVRAAERELPAGDLRRAPVVQNLGVLLQQRYEGTGDRISLDECVRVRRQALGERADPADPGQADRLSGLSIALRLRHELTGSGDDLAESVSTARQAVDIARALAAPLGGSMSMLAAALQSRYRAHGSLSDLDEAISLDRAAAEEAGAGLPERAMYLYNLGTAAHLRFLRTGQPADLDESIAATRAALAGHRPASQYQYLSGLAMALLDRYQRTGNLADLNEAVQAARDANGVGSPADTRQAERLGNLGLALRVRFEHTGDLADIDAAIEAARAAVEVTGSDRERGRSLTNLSSALQLRFTRAADSHDLDAAVTISQQAVDACPPGHPDRPATLSVLSLALKTQAEIHGWPGLPPREPGHPAQAVAAARQAVAATAPGDVARPGRLANLGEALYVRFTRTGSVPDADEAIESARAALRLHPPGHPQQASIQSSLGQFLFARARAQPGGTSQRQLLAEAFATWREGTGLRAAPARIRVACASRWAQAAREAGLATEAEHAYTAAIGVLPFLAWRGFDRVTQEGQLAVWGSLATDAAAWAVTAGRPERAVELLEQGRTILWSQLLQTRDEVDDLRAADPGRAQRLDSIRAALDGGEDAPAVSAEQRMRAAAEWDALIEEIRAQPGFKTFLAIPPFAQLAAATAGPVAIINVSQFRCDALVVTRSGVQVIGLPGLTEVTAAERAAAFRQALDQAAGPGSWWTDRSAAQQAVDAVLGWLWDTVTAPVLSALNLIQPHPGQPEAGSLPRIWWCPTGPLAQLPLHAAGPGPGCAGTSDHVVSSYIPTLRTLQRTRSSQPEHGAQPERLLLVTMPETPGLPGDALPGAVAEGRLVAGRFRGELTHYTGPAATTQPVTAAVSTHSHAHFACHGGIHPGRPTQSGLRLFDGVLTISALSRTHRRRSGLAVLSACETGTGSTSHPEEAITMGTALHMAGFAHVVATLWSTEDDLAPTVADHLYAALSTQDGQLAVDGTAYAMHAAIQNLRARGAHPIQWAPYFHSGP